jgi:hypothetical protein
MSFTAPVVGNVTITAREMVNGYLTVAIQNLRCMTKITILKLHPDPQFKARRPKKSA